MLIRPRRARPINIKSSERDKGSLMRMLQGIVVLGFGIIFIVANANTVGSPYKVLSGHVLKSYEKTIDGQYNSNYLNLSTDPQDLFVFDKNAFHPTWNGQVYLGSEVEIHYLDKTPKTIVAFQIL